MLDKFWMHQVVKYDFTADLTGIGDKASFKLFELDVRTPGDLFLGVQYARGVDFRHFRRPMPSLPFFGVILGLLETSKM